MIATILPTFTREPKLIGEKVEILGTATRQLGYKARLLGTSHYIRNYTDGYVILTLDEFEVMPLLQPGEGITISHKTHGPITGRIASTEYRGTHLISFELSVPSMGHRTKFESITIRQDDIQRDETPDVIDDEDGSIAYAQMLERRAENGTWFGR